MLYSLKYEMMVHILQQFSYSGIFRADIPPRSPLKDGGQAILIVDEGTITSCFIANKQGQKIYNDGKAVQMFQRLGIMDWQFAPSPTIPAGVGQASRRDSATNPEQKQLSPHLRHLPVPQSTLSTWSTLQRSVYLLADGTRTIEQIATLLSRPLNVVEQVIYSLRSKGFIEVLP